MAAAATETKNRWLERDCYTESVPEISEAKKRKAEESGYRTEKLAQNDPQFFTQLFSGTFSYSVNSRFF